jgi:NTE family protein
MKALVLLLGLAAGLHAAPAPPKVALVLSGSGPRGLAHAGVMQALDELRVPVELVVGTSGGALVGGFASLGLGGAEIRDKLLADFNFFELFDDRVSRQKVPLRLKERDFNYLNLAMGFGEGGGFRMSPGLSSGRRIRLRLRRALADAAGEDDFSQLPVPFRATATDLGAGRNVALDHGDLADAVMASLSVPAVFAPVELSGTVYADGLLFDNLPIEPALSRGPRAMVVVDLTTPIKEERDYKSVLSVATRLLDVSVGDNMRKQLALLRPQDVMLRPAVGDFGNMDYQRSAETYELGRQAVKEQEGKLKGLALGEKDYAAWKASRRAPLKPRRWILAQVKVEPAALESLALVHLPLALGKPLDLARLEKGLDDLSAGGRFEDLDYHIVPLDRDHSDEVRLELRLTEKRWGPNFLGVGLKLITDFEGFNQFETLLELTQSRRDHLGAEFRHRAFLGRVNGYEGEWYQPLGDTPFFLAPGATLQNRLGLLQLSASADLGLTMGSSAELRVGVQGGRFWSPPPGDNSLSGWVDLAGVRAQLALDSLDDPHFPSTGHYLKATAGEARTDFMSAPVYRFAGGGGYQAFHAGPHVALLGAEISSHWDSFTPVFAEPNLGGFLRLTGYHPGAFRGQELALGRLIYYYRVKRPLAVFGETLIFGTALELGQVYSGTIRQDAGRERASLSLLFGMRTVLGPLYLAHGRNAEGGGASYFFLGSPF